jgi:hypothetical protein
VHACFPEQIRSGTCCGSAALSSPGNGWSVVTSSAEGAFTAIDGVDKDILMSKGSGKL